MLHVPTVITLCANRARKTLGNGPSVRGLANIQINLMSVEGCVGPVTTHLVIGKILLRYVKNDGLQDLPTLKSSKKEMLNEERRDRFLNTSKII